MSLASLIGQTLDGKYEIVRELGRGGMGTVYFAIHLGTERPVAVKVISPQFMRRDEFIERFRREARAAGRLRHPNVVDVTDFGITDSSIGKVAYLVMEYLDGCTLGEILEEEKQLPLSWTLDILEQVCSAVDVAHSQGIIHRDLKPENIWLEPNQRGGYTVKVLDFGIAKLEEAQFRESQGLPAITSSDTQNFQTDLTISDGDLTETLVEHRNPTLANEDQTLLQNAEGQTLTGNNENITVSENSTLIQTPTVVDSESSTVIMPDVDTATQAEVSTKIFTQQPVTDKKPTKMLNTNALTRIGAVLGTPLYMSPEQCRGEKLDARADVYSLGIIAYQMLEGKTPFEGTFTEVMKAHKVFEPPTLEAKKIPKKVKRVIMESLSKNPDERPQTALAFASRLRAHSEGIGELLRNSLILYTEHFSKFLLIAFLTGLPMLILSTLLVGFQVLRVSGIDDSFWLNLLSTPFIITSAFAKIFCAALLVGTTTWVVAQILAVPLKPVNLKAAFKVAQNRWKPLAGTVTASTLLAMLGFVCCLIPGFILTANYMLVAPVVMMEGLRGREAFRRSVSLVKRSYRTVLATILFVYFFPGILGGILGFASEGIALHFVPGRNIDLSGKIIKIDEKKSNEKVPTISINGEKIVINGDEKPGSETADAKPEPTETDEEKAQNEEKTKEEKRVREIVRLATIELFSTPLAILLGSLTSVITALVYFKTRQAGGESMTELLSRYEEAERPRSNWQKRVRERLEQSGRITSKS
jgi:serine/threonine protein kinase